MLQISHLFLVWMDLNYSFFLRYLQKDSIYLQIPPFQYGIIAGGKGDNEGYSSILEGDDDAIVRVSETQLRGADGFLVIPVRHSRMMKNTDVQMETLNFLQKGQFTKKTYGTNISEKWILKNSLLAGLLA